MRYLGNDTNIVRDAELTATNGVPSSAIYRTDTAAKTGGGLVELTGPYTGAADTTIDVEIVDNGGATTQVSQPLFSGVGNGTMSDVEAVSIDPQTVTVVLRDLGTETRAAYAQFQGVTLKARATGGSGNDIKIVVDHSALVAADTDWSLQEDLRQDQNEYIGDHWNFGAAVLEAPGNLIPADAPRLRIGTDPQVYRQYKKYVNGRYVYSFNPAPARDIQRGAKVHTITGTRTVTITDGATTETLTNIVTLYDALVQIDASTLLKVDGAVVNDRAPGGQGITDLSVRTASYVLGVNTTESGPIARVELDVDADDNAPTETLTITCSDAAIPGAEKWDVFGDVSNALARATTGVRYEDGRYVFTIPLPEVNPAATSGVITVEYLPDGPRDESATIPDFCPVLPLIGAAGRDGSWTFTYAHRPPADCDCQDGDYEGAPNEHCLGITPEGGSVSDASVMVRLQLITAELAKLAVINTDPPSGAPSTTVGYNDKTIALLNASASILVAGLIKLPGGTLTWPAWQASLAIGRDEIREPTTPNGYRYAATTPGTSGTVEPSWPTTVGSTVSGDGGVTWTCISKKPYETFDEAYAQWLDDVDYYETASETVSQVDIDQYNNRYRGLINNVLTTAEITPNFDDAGTNGDGCWHDYNDGDFWWVSEGVEPPYMPLQTGHYNYSAKQGFDSNGKPFIYSTKEWGFGIRIGCADSLVVGDRLKINISGAGGGNANGYAVGDAFTVRVTQASPLPFGGGQTGDDTLTWGVQLSVDGAQVDYALVTTAVAPYSISVGGGTLEFQINPGGIRFELGDTFTFAIEGGRFKWRQDGGSWSSSLDIADTLLVDGLTAKFTGGAAPSWSAGDRWSFAAEATFGIDQVRKPIDGEFEWLGSTQIDIVPSDDTETVGIGIANHAIPDDAVIRLQGSDDNFSTTPLNEVVPWRKGDIWHAVAADRAKYRVTIDKGGRARWLYLGESTVPGLVTGLPELGALTKRRRLSKTAQRAAVGGSVAHSGLAQSGVDALFDMLDHAGDNDRGLFGIVPNDARGELGIVRCSNDPVPVDDVHGFQPENIANSLQSVTLELEAAA